jgi:cation:H+ antiporter
MLLSFVLLVIGLALLIKGADLLVDGASWLAKKYNVSDLAIGLTIVAFGTSAPELVVNIIASTENHQDIVFGNILGSNIFNLFAILGITGLITPLAVQSSTVWKEIPVSLIAVIAVLILANDVLFFSTPENVFGRIDGIIMLVLFVSFLYYVFTQLKNEKKEEHLLVSHKPTIHLIGYIVAGLAGLIFGGKLVVESAVDIASQIGVSERIIGLTIVAVGTSLPELVTSIVAARKKNIDLAVGNIIGSNIFNIFFILGISSLIRPISYPLSFNLSLYLLIGGTLFLFIAMFTGVKQKLDRWEAAILLLCYVGYTFYLLKFEA